MTLLFHEVIDPTHIAICPLKNDPYCQFCYSHLPNTWISETQTTQTVEKAATSLEIFKGQEDKDKRKQN